MLRISIILTFIILFSLTALSNAQYEPAPKVKEMVFCTALEDRQPVGADSIFTDTVDVVYCFTKMVGAEDTTAIFHVWYYNEEEKARVELAVKSKSWRTWSSKQILRDWDGIWRVDILSSTGKMLRSKEFLVKPTTD